jgi:hypothetical protein
VKRALVVLVLLVGCLAPATAAHATVGFNVTTEEMGGQPLDVAVGDLDGRNGPDIVAALAEGGLSVRLNNGNGTFGEPHLYPTGCETYQVELADLGGTGGDNTPDGHLDAAILCVFNSGDTQELGRLAGNGNGTFGPVTLAPELNRGPFQTPSPQSFALAEVRAPGLPPVPTFTYIYSESFPATEYRQAFCYSYDWQTTTCLTGQSYPNTGAPLVAGKIAESRVFGLGGEQGLVDWGPNPNWSFSSRELAPNLPTTAENFKSIAVGDLASDGPDLISASGTCGCGSQDSPAAGLVDVSYGNAAGVPDQAGTKFASAPGVTNIATGDFDLDGHTDLIGTSWSYDPAAAVSTGSVFVQSGNGAGALGPPQMIPISHSEAFSRSPIRVADLDGNGAPDAVAIVGGKVQVLINQKTPAPPALPPTAGKALNPLAGLSGLPNSVRPDKKGNLLLGTATNPPTASVELTITLPPAKGKKGKGKGKATAAAAKPKKGKPKGLVIGHSLIKIPAGKKQALKVHLSKVALAKLKKGPLKTTLAIVAVAIDGTKKATSQSLTIKPAKAKKKHKH